MWYNFNVVKIKNLRSNITLLVLGGLLFLSFAFFVTAEEKSNGAGNIFLDSDQDGLTDEEEKLYETDPKNRDTDGDGYSDGAEVKSGYDPRKPAPGDKIMESAATAPKVAGTETETAENPEEESNLTSQIAQKISAMTLDTSENQEITLEEIQTMIDESLASQDTEIKLPEIPLEEIRVKEQNYGGLSKDEAQKKKKEDLENYLIAVYYILSSNSPEPLTSANDLGKIITSFSSKMISAVSTRDASSLEDLGKSGERIREQLKEIEVPEDLVDIHIEILRFAEYTFAIKELISPKTEDPMGDIVKLSQIQNFIGAISNFATQVETKFFEYDLSYDENVKEKLEDLGLIAPDPEDLENLLENPNNETE